MKTAQNHRFKWWYFRSFPCHLGPFVTVKWCHHSLSSSFTALNLLSPGCLAKTSIDIFFRKTTVMPLARARRKGTKAPMYRCEMIQIYHGCPLGKRKNIFQRCLLDPFGRGCDSSHKGISFNLFIIYYPHMCTRFLFSKIVTPQDHWIFFSHGRKYSQKTPLKV